MICVRDGELSVTWEIWKFSFLGGRKVVLFSNQVYSLLYCYVIWLERYRKISMG